MGCNIPARDFFEVTEKEGTLGGGEEEEKKRAGGVTQQSELSL